MATPSIVIDTNIILSALKSKQGASFRLISLLGTNRFTAHLSVPLFLEYQDVCLRDFPNSNLSLQDISVYLNYLCGSMSHDTISFLWRPHLTDPKDDMVLELAINSHSQAIISYNERDLSGASVFGITILTPAEFLRSIGAVP